MGDTLRIYALAAVVLTPWLPTVKRRLELSRAKPRSLAGHSRMAKRVPFYAYGDDRFFSSDDVPAAIADRRRTALQRLGRTLRERAPKSIALTTETQVSVSDLQFTSAYRVPYQYAGLLREHVKTGSFVQSASGVTVTDLDGNLHCDLTGSYGVNVFGVDFYTQCMAEGSARVQDLGPVLGAFHPCVALNVTRLREISGLDEVSFHMSGTEAVMQAVRLALHHTGRSHLVSFCGAHHGWWEDVQPGIGDPSSPNCTYTLTEIAERSLKVLRSRKDIACVLVNPLQALHPNKGAPGDSSLLDSGRSAHFDRVVTTQWLKQLREVCTERGIVLIVDEVLMRGLPNPRYPDLKTGLPQTGALFGLWCANRPDLVPTESLRRELAEQGFRDLSVVARGADTVRFHLAKRGAELRRHWDANDDDTVVICVGRLAPEKNLNDLVSAYQAMRRIQPRTSEELLVHDASADAFLFPSLTETFGNVTPEAMASGLPVLAYDYAAAAQLIEPGESGLLATYGAASDFISLTERLVTDPQHGGGCAANRRAVGLGRGDRPGGSAVQCGRSRWPGRQCAAVVTGCCRSVSRTCYRGSDSFFRELTTRRSPSATAHRPASIHRGSGLAAAPTRR